MAESLKQKTRKGTLWTAIDTFAMRGVSFLVTLLMARILTPADYGLVGMIAIFMAIANSLIDSGFSQALIRKQDRTYLDDNTVFYFNIVVGLALYAVLFFCAPLISRFYGEPQLTLITRVLGITLVINSLGIVQRAILTHDLEFKILAKVSIFSSITSGAVGVAMAFMDFGVWAIVWQQFANSLLSTVLIWIFAKWKPILVYSWKSFKDLFGFGSKLLASGLIDTTYNNVYGLVIGKIFKAADLGYYSRAASFPDIVSPTLTGIVQRVAFPVLCTIQEDNERLADIYRRIIRTSAYMIFPLVLLIAAVGKPMIQFLLTDKWLYAAVLLVPICFNSIWYPLHAINLSLLRVKGRSDLFLKLEILKKIVGVAILCITVPFGLYAMCWGGVVGSIIALIINTHYTGKLINVGFLKQVHDILPTLVLSVTMGLLVYITVSILPLPEVILLIIGGVEGIGFYLIASKLLKMKEMQEALAFIKNK